MERLSHDQMAFAITKLYPQLKHGKDFWVAHPVARNGGQIGEAFIVEWPKGLDKPDRKVILKTFNAHANEFNARRARLERDAKLRDSDWTQMPDVEESKRKAWAKYRQELRNLLQQQHFPANIVWPEPPA